MSRYFCLLSLLCIFCLVCVGVKSAELETSVVSDDAGYVIHVDIVAALQDKANGKVFYQKWIQPMLDGYRANIASKNIWNSNTVSSITFFGLGSYTNYQNQVFVFTPTKTSWLKEIRNSLNTNASETNMVRFSKNGYTAILTGKHLYVSQSKDAVTKSVTGKKGNNPLFKTHAVDKSYIVLLMDKQFRDIFDLPFSSYFSKNIDSVCLFVDKHEEKASMVGLDFTLGASADPAIFASHSKKVVQGLSLIENDWNDFLTTSKMEVNGHNLLMKNALDKLQYRKLLLLIFGV